MVTIRLGVAVAVMDVGSVGLVGEASVAGVDFEAVVVAAMGSSGGVVGEDSGEAIVEAIAVAGAAAATLYLLLCERGYGWTRLYTTASGEATA